MKKTLYALTLTLLIGKFTLAYSAQSDTAQLGGLTPISLKSAIAQGLRKNHDQELRQFSKLIYELDYKDDKEEFWLPQIKLDLSTTDDRLGSAFSDKKDDSYNSPTGVMALDFGEYTLFNWGKDYLKFLNDQSNYNRDTKKLSEESRDLKYDIMMKYLDLLTAKKISKVRQTALRHASFVFRFNYDKAKLKKISKQEFYQSKAQYLDSQTQYQAAKDLVNTIERELSYLINDPTSTNYHINEKIKFTRLKGKRQTLISLAKKNNSNILDVKNELLTSDRSYQIEKKDNLPLPKISLNLGAYKYQFDDNFQKSHFENSLGSDGVDLVATINASWTLTGPGGLFNSRRKHKALLNKNIAIKKLVQSKHNVENVITTLFKRIQYFERNQPILTTSVQTNIKSFDVVLDNYTAKRTRFINLKEALTDKTDKEIELLTNTLEHAKTKIFIAKISGIDDLPGESLEQLTVYGDE